MDNSLNKVEVTKNDLSSLINELSGALIRFTQEGISQEQAQKIAYIAINSIDFNNSALTHKGVNWYAREIIDTLDF